MWDHLPLLQPQQRSQSGHCLLQFVLSEMQRGAAEECWELASSSDLLCLVITWAVEAATQRDGVGPQALGVSVKWSRVEQAWREESEMGMEKEGATGLMEGEKRKR